MKQSSFTSLKMADQRRVENKEKAALSCDDELPSRRWSLAVVEPLELKGTAHWSRKVPGSALETWMAC